MRRVHAKRPGPPMKSYSALLCLAFLLGACRSTPSEPLGEPRGDKTSADGSPGVASPQTEPSARVRPKGPPGPPPQVSTPEKWNYPSVAWTTNQAGLSRMKASGRPGLVVLQGDWCPHCRRLAKVFSDPEIERLSDSFELILIDSDTPEAESYESTGTYVPRTLFLRPDGTIDTGLRAPGKRFAHFFSVDDKDALIRAMKTAISRYGS